MKHCKFEYEKDSVDYRLGKRVCGKELCRSARTDYCKTHSHIMVRRRQRQAARRACGLEAA